MPLSKGVEILGAGFLTTPGHIAFGVAFLVSTILGCLVRHGSKSGFYFWCAGLALNVPTLVLLGRLAAGAEPLKSSVDSTIAILVVLALGPFGIAWLIGSMFGLPIRVAAANTRGYRT